MIPFIQSAEQPCRVPLAFDQATADGISGLRWAVAYITEAGSHELVNRLSQRLGRSWDEATKVIVTSCDYGITEPDAIDFLAGLNNCRLMLASPDVLTQPGFRPATAFHPKLYLFDLQAGLAAIVGSANLTVRAFTNNCEAVSLYRSAKPETIWEAAWAALTTNAIDFTPELRAQYRASRAGHPPLIDVDPPVPPEPVVQGVLHVFLDEILAGRLVPGAFEHLWVEAGSMSSSASHNQLELPRGGNRFFGFSFAQYDTSQTDIGFPVLLVRGHPFHNRKLAWHGDNGMERIYLPTENQSGLVYQWQLILFRRTATGFDLDVFPWDSAAAVACRAASQQIGRVYRLGAGSSRICGVY